MLVYAGVAVLTGVLGALQNVPLVGDLVHLAIAALFLGAALRMARRDPDPQRFGIDMVVAIGGGQPGALLGNSEAGAVALAYDIKSHHAGQFVGDAVGLKIGDD